MRARRIKKQLGLYEMGKVEEQNGEGFPDSTSGLYQNNLWTGY